MSKYKEKVKAGINPFIEPRATEVIAAKTGNLFRSIAIMSRRSNQISSELKEELHGKLAEFASSNDNLEEIFENREQIEICKFYERMPNPALLTLDEFMNDEVYFRQKDENEPIELEKPEKKEPEKPRESRFKDDIPAV